MEENIKRCKALLKNDRWVLGTEDKKAIDALIKEYEEIKETNKDLSDAFWNKCVPNQILKEIIDECIPKGKNIITGKEEYQPNTNANSFLTQEILKLMEGR